MLLPKKGKNPSLPSSYRPICLVNTIEKLYEMILVNRLEAELAERSRISVNQHEFRRRKSTETDIMKVRERIVSIQSRWVIMKPLDIKNAFYTAR